MVYSLKNMGLTSKIKIFAKGVAISSLVASQLIFSQACNRGNRVQKPKLAEVCSKQSTATCNNLKSWMTKTDYKKLNARKSGFIVQSGDRLYVYDPFQKNQIVSEGMAYGLLLSIQANDQDTFDGLLRGLATMTKKGLPSWRGYLNSNGEFYVAIDSDSNSASDADQDIAMALIQAQALVEKKVWKEPVNPETGKKDKNYYGKKAREFLKLIWDKEVSRINGSYILKPSEDWGYYGGSVIVNPSYFMPAWYDVFAEFDNDQSHNWKALKDSSYKIIEKAFEKYGNIPDWCRVAILGNEMEIFDADSMSNEMGFDAIRVLLRVAQDAMISKSETEKKRAVMLSRKLVEPIIDKNIDELQVAYYDPNTGQSGFTKSPTLVAMYAVSALAASTPLEGETQSDVKKFLDLNARLENYLKSYFESAGISDMYYQESLLLFGSIIGGGLFSEFTPEKFRRDSPVEERLRSRHRNYFPLYNLEALPIIGQLIMPYRFENNSYIWLDPVKSTELDMFIEYTKVLEDKDPKKTRTLHTRKSYMRNLLGWGYYDEVIRQYEMIASNMKYNDKKIDKEELELKRKILKESTDFFLSAVNSSGNIYYGIDVLNRIVSKDPDNIISRVALAGLYSLLPKKEYKDLAFSECKKIINLMYKNNFNDPEVLYRALFIIFAVDTSRSEKHTFDQDSKIVLANYVEKFKNLYNLADGKINGDFINLGLHPQQVIYINDLLGKANWVVKARIKLDGANILLSMLDEILLCEEIKMNTGINYKLDEDLFNQLGNHYKDLILFYKGAISDILNKPLKVKIKRAAWKDYITSDKETDIFYNACLGIERVYSNYGKLKKLKGLDSKKEFDDAFATIGIMNDIEVNSVIKNVLSREPNKKLSDDELTRLVYEAMDYVEDSRASLRLHFGKRVIKKFMDSLKVQLKLEKMQIQNNRGDYQETINDFEQLLRENIFLGRVRTHFERIIYYLDNMEYVSAISDCESLTRYLNDFKNRNFEKKIFSDETKKKLFRIQSLFLDILKDEDYIRRGKLNKVTETKYNDIISSLKTLVESENVLSPVYELALIKREINGEEVINLDEAYSELLRVIETNRMLEIETLKAKSGQTFDEQFEEKVSILENIEKIKEYIKNGRYKNARYLCEKMIAKCKFKLGEGDLVFDVPKLILIDGISKYALALAKTGRPLEAIAIYKSILGMDYSFVDFTETSPYKNSIELNLSPNVKNVILTLGDKEFRGFIERLFRSAPYLKNEILAKLGELYIWSETQSIYIEKLGEEQGKIESFKISKKYLEEVYKLDPSNKQVIKLLKDVSLWLHWLEKDQKQWDDSKKYEKLLAQ